MRYILHMLKMVVKIIVAVILIIILLIIGLLLIISFKPFVPDNYTRSVKTGGEIEAYYMAVGDCEVLYTEYAASDEWEKYEVWYPADIEISEEIYPVVIVANGTGVKASKYKALFKHLASWGFIVVGNEDPSTYAGISADASLKLLIGENENKNSIFYQKVDKENIGITGHSQGGVAVFNEIKENKLSNMYTCAVSLSPTQEDWAQALGIAYNPTDIEIPVLITTASENDVITLEGLKSLYEKLNGTKAMTRRICDNHGEMLYSADGYVTAWFMYWLKKDEKAGTAFFGQKPELCRNALYQDTCIEIKN